jgi:hypothetical protein
VILWSDGGKAFKNFRGQYEEQQLLQEHNIKVHRLWFASNHGKALADAHAGVLKGQVKHWRIQNGKFLRKY